VRAGSSRPATRSARVFWTSRRPINSSGEATTSAVAPLFSSRRCRRRSARRCPRRRFARTVRNQRPWALQGGLPRLGVPTDPGVLDRVIGGVGIAQQSDREPAHPGGVGHELIHPGARIGIHTQRMSLQHDPLEKSTGASKRWSKRDMPP
jgi:hypothetical protein